MKFTERKFALVPELAFREIADTIAVVHPRENRLYTLNDAAGFLWKMLEEGKGVGQIANKMAEVFEVDEVDALRDCRSFVCLMMERGLVTEVVEEEG